MFIMKSSWLATLIYNLSLIFWATLALYWPCLFSCCSSHSIAILSIFLCIFMHSKLLKLPSLSTDLAYSLTAAYLFSLFLIYLHFQLLFYISNSSNYPRTLLILSISLLYHVYDILFIFYLLVTHFLYVKLFELPSFYANLVRYAHLA